MKKFLSLMLAVLMVLSVVPATVFAEGATMNEALNADGCTFDFTAKNFAVKETEERTYAYSTIADQDSEEASIKLVVEAKEGDIVAFDLMTSTEEFFDVFEFAVDGDVVIGQSGETDWASYAYIFEEDSTFVLTWKYIKDSSDGYGDDMIAVDNIYVGENNFELEGIKTNDSIVVAVDGEKEIVVEAIPAFVELPEEITFTSANEDIATVDEYGIVTGVAEGETFVTVTAGGFANRIAVKVLGPVTINTFLAYDGETEEMSGLFEVELISNERELIEDIGGINAAEYVNGYIYVSATDDEEQDYFGVIDADTYEVVDLQKVDYYVGDLTFDETTYTLYGTMPTEEAGSIVAIDLDTYEAEILADLEFYAITLADYEGTLYAVAYETGDFYAINGETFEATLLYNTGFEPNYLQTMAFDNETARLFWLGLDYTGSSPYTFNAELTPEGIILLNENTGLTEFVGAYYETEVQDTVAVTGVELDKTEETIKWQDTLTLTATVLPENATNKRVKWSSSDEKIATVKNGVVTPVAEGEVTITVTTVDGEFTAECKVTITDAPEYVLYEDFEDKVEGWTFEDKDGDGYGWLNTLDEEDMQICEAYEGSYMAMSASYVNNVGPLTPDNWMISPAFKADETMLASWAVKGQDADYCEEHYGVYVLPADYTDLSQAKELYVGNSTSAWQVITESLKDYAGQEIRIAFRHFDITDMYFIDIDLICVMTFAEEEPLPETHTVTFMDGETEIAKVEVEDGKDATAPEAPAKEGYVFMGWDKEFTAVTEDITVNAIYALIGDANADGIVNTADAVTILKFAAEMVTLEDLGGESWKLYADMNQDKEINTADAVAILKYCVSTPTEPGDSTDSDVTGSDVTDSAN